MKYEQLGATGVFVSRISLGAMSFGGRDSQLWDAVGALDVKETDRMVGTALDHGVNLIDTANVYAEGESEELLGEVLGARRRDVILATKMTARTAPGPNDVGQSRLHIMRSLEDSLRRLRTDHIDLYQIHNLDPLTPFEESLAALDDAVHQGKIRYIGASNLAAWEMMKALGVSERRGWARFSSLQSYYSLAGRDIEREILPVVRDQRLGLLVWSPLAAGLLSGKFDRTGTSDDGARRARFAFPPVNLERAYDIIDVLRQVAARHEVGVSRVALAWVLAQPGVTSAIVGAKRPEQLVENLAAVELELTAQDLAELDAVSALPAEYPGWIIEGFRTDARLPQTA
ncbi:aldo/keto reductase [Streptosporangium lutulentum]|uniref:Aryl-alcohol dehydrogenase-like predicted oxidoreductase n=1 Tax=Streptosporangium lutulentum TaxID=1461250 RepID=A0ABT9QS48_9ACTN|nr:aldo/keto reductase [Streptosporangium lutulentum]MDP9848869.1 aryl-alcohol dehydrogenase-like predicted oxidoreductase [Streptosporangium lutulentum]